MADAVRVPVELEVLQSSVKQVESILDNLQPHTSSWNELSKILSSMRKEADNLGIALSRPFTSQTQFNAAQKSINKINEALDKVKLASKGINFSDIKLTPDQTATFNQLQKQLADLEKQVTTFKTNIRNSWFQNDNDIGKDLIKIDPTLVTKNFDDIIKIVKQKGKQIEQAYKNTQEILKSDEFKNLESRTNMTKKFFSESADKFFTSDMLGAENWNKIFNSKGGFRAGGSNLLIEWAKQNLVLPENELDALKGKTFNTIKKYFEGLDAKSIIKNAEEGFSAKKDSLNEKVQQYETLQRVLGVFNNAQSQVSAQEDKLSDSTNKAKEALEAFKTIITAAAQSSGSLDTKAQALASQLKSLNTALDNSNTKLLQMQRTTNTFNSLRMAIVNFMGFNQVLNLTRTAVKNAMNHIKELDSVMNKISIVTDMSTSDLWNQVDAYSSMAQKYGVSIKGAYEVSQIYYQQGLQTADVMTLTNETLKLAKISGLDYAQTTDYMTTALRGFKMEMSEASTVVDVYSNLAAHTAVSQEELAIAMSKTASSMEGVGATFQEASAMIGTMVAVTRESATNIGTALKSIASRYGELTKDPSKLIDSEGEAMAFNKVDAALQSVGISMKTTDGQFREFTDVIIELGEKWDQLDSVQQRYIATQFAGNRQQSRFLALVSNVDLLKQNIETAENSEDVGTLQALKALDSVESKLEQVRVSYQQFYTTIGAETLWKGALDGLRNYIDTLNGLPKLFGKIPAGAIAMIANLVGLLRGIGDKLIEHVANIWHKITPDTDAANATGKAMADGIANGLAENSNAITQAMAQILAQAGQTVQGTTQAIVAQNVAKSTEKTKESDQQGQQLNTFQALKETNFEQTFKDEITKQGIDLSNITTATQDQINNILTSILQSSPEIAEAFRQVGLDAGAGYVNGLIQQMSGAPAAGSQAANDVTSAIVNTTNSNLATVEGAGQAEGAVYIAGLRNGMTTHSDSVEGGRATQDVVNSVVHTSEAGQESVRAAGEGLGKATLEGLTEELKKVDEQLADISKHEGGTKRTASRKINAAEKHIKDLDEAIKTNESREITQDVRDEYIKSGIITKDYHSHLLDKKALTSVNTAIDTLKAQQKDEITQAEIPLKEAQAELDALKQRPVEITKRLNDLYSAGKDKGREYKSLQAEQQGIPGKIETATKKVESVRKKVEEDKKIIESKYEPLLQPLQEQKNAIINQALDKAEADRKDKLIKFESYKQDDLDKIYETEEWRDTTLKDYQGQREQLLAQRKTIENEIARENHEKLSPIYDMREPYRDKSPELSHSLSTSYTQPIEARDRDAFVGTVAQAITPNVPMSSWADLTKAASEEVSKTPVTVEVHGDTKPLKEEIVEATEETGKKGKGKGKTKKKTEPILEETNQPKKSLTREEGYAQIDEFAKKQAAKKKQQQATKVSTASQEPIPVNIADAPKMQPQIQSMAVLAAQFNPQKPMESPMELFRNGPVIRNVSSEGITFNGLGGSHESIDAEINSNEALIATLKEMLSLRQQINSLPEGSKEEKAKLQESFKEHMNWINPYLEQQGKSQLSWNSGETSIKDRLKQLTGEPKATAGPAAYAPKVEEPVVVDTKVDTPNLIESVENATEEAEAAAEPIVIETEVEEPKEEEQSSIEEIPEQIEEVASELFENADGQLSFFDNMVNASETAAAEVTENVQKIQEAEGQLQFNNDGNIVNPDLEKYAQGQLTNLQSNYEYDAESDQYVPVEDYSGAAMSVEEYNNKLANLKQQLAEARGEHQATTGAAEQTTGALIREGEAGQQSGDKVAEGAEKGAAGQKKLGQAAQETANNLLHTSQKTANWGSAIGRGLSIISGFFDKTTAGGEAAAGAVTMLGGAITMLLSTGPMAIITGITTLITGAIQLIQSNSLEKQLERAEKKAEELSNKSKETKANFNTLDKGIEKYNELSKSRYESAEAAEEYQAQVDDLTTKFPELLLGFDEAGNAILDTKNMEDVLADAREASAEATLAAVKAEREKAELEAKKATKALTDQLADIEFSDESLQAARGASAATVAANHRPDDWLHLYSGGINRLLQIFYDSSEVGEYMQRLSNKEDVQSIFQRLAEDGRKEQLEEDTAKTSAVDHSWVKLVSSAAFMGAYDTTTNEFNLTTLRDNLQDMVERGEELSLEEDLMLQYLTELLGSTVNLMEEFNEEIQSNSADIKSIANEQLRQFLQNEDGTVKFATDIDAMNAILQEMRTAATNGDTEGVNKYYTWLKEFIHSLPDGSDILKYATEQLEAIETQLAPVIREYNVAQNEKQAASRKEISATLNSSKYLSTTFRKSSAMMGLLTEYLEPELKSGEDVTQFLDDRKDLISLIDDFWESLGHQYDENGKNLQEKLTAMLEDGEHYSAEDIIRDLGISPDDLDIINLFTKVFKDSNKYDKVIENLTTKLEGKNASDTNLDELRDWIQTYDNKFLTSIDRSFYGIIANRIEDLEDRGRTPQATTLLDAATTLRTELDNLDEETRNAILDSIKENGIATNEAISKVKSRAKAAGVEETDAVYKALEALEATTTTNIKLSMEALTDELVSTWGDSSKTLKKLTSGIDLTDVQEILNQADNFGDITLASGKKFSLTHADFKQNGNQLVLTTEKASEYWEAFSQYNYEQAQHYLDELNAAKATLTLSSNEAVANRQLTRLSMTKEGYAALETVMGDELEKYLAKDENGKVQIVNGLGVISDIDGLRTRLSAKMVEDQEAIDDYLQYLADTDGAIQKALDWKQGNYSSLSISKNRLFSLARGNTYLTKAEYEEPDIKNAIESVQSAVNTLLTDITTKGADYVIKNIQSYEGIAEEDIHGLISGPIENIVMNCAQLAGKSLEEVNNAIVSAFEDKYKKTSENVLKDVTFSTDGSQVSTSLAGIGSLANTFGVQSDVLIGLINDYYDVATEKLTIDVQTLASKGINLMNANGLAKALSASVETVNNEFAEKFTEQNKKQVADNLKDLDFITKDTFTTSFDGLKNLANAYGLSLEKLTEAYYDAGLEKATINVSDLLADFDVDLTAVNNFTETVQESIDNMFNDLASMIGNAIEGKLKISDIKELREIASQFGIGENDLQFVRTKDGYKATEDSLSRIYFKLKEADSLTAQIVLDKFNDSAEKSTMQLKKANAELEKLAKANQITDEQQRYYDLVAQAEKDEVALAKSAGLNGNVDLLDRPVITHEGSNEYNTLLGATFGSKQFETNVPWAMNISAIPVIRDQDGNIITGENNILSRNALTDYIQNIIDKAGGADATIEDILAADKEGIDGISNLIMEIVDATNDYDGTLAKVEAHAVEVHEISAAIEDVRTGYYDRYDDTKISQYERELELNREIMEVRATTESDDFKFMDNNIPSGQNNPLNYWENWGKAMKAIKETTEGDSKGFMDYKDFYNIITQMGQLASESNKITIGGKEVLANSEDAADLIRRAGRALSVTADGSIKVDLSKLGIDFAAGADTMNANVEAAIDQLADSWIEMLDSMIQLLETVVAMENLEDIDVDNDNTIEISDIFPKLEYDDKGNVVEFEINEAYETWRKEVNNQIQETINGKKNEDYNEDLAKAAKNLKIDGISFETILGWSPEELASQGKDFLQKYTAVMDSFWKMAKSGNYDLNNLIPSIKEILGGTGLEGEIELDDRKLVIHQGTVFEKDEDNKIIWNGKKFNSVEAAARAESLEQITALQGLETKYNAETGDISYKAGKYSIDTTYDIENNCFIANFSDGGSVSAESQQALNAAIRTYLLAQNIDTSTGEQQTSTTASSKTLQYSVTLPGKATVDVELDIEANEVKVKNQDPNIPINKEIAETLSKVGEAAHKVEKEVSVTPEVEIKAADEASTVISQVKEALNDLTKEPYTVTIKGKVEGEYNGSPNSGLGSGAQDLDESLTKTSKSLDGFKLNTVHATSEFTEANTEYTNGVKQSGTASSTAAQNLYNLADNAKSAGDAASGAAEKVASAAKALNDIPSSKNIEITATVKVEASGGTVESQSPEAGTKQTIYGGAQEAPAASGNVALATGTLMGELGPELVVSGGRYFVVGQHGAEFVDLADDAIVFNHLQTQQLLKNGMSPSRGKALTSEKNAIAFAQGHMGGGPAMASARDALAALKQLRAMWEALKGASVKDLAGKGGGGGGGGDKGDSAERKAWIEAVERWYNLMQQIAELEREITHEEALRTKLQSDWQKNGKAYYASQKASLQALEKQTIAQMQLNIDQEDYFNQRREKLNESQFKRLYTFDENGTLQYNDEDLGFAWLSDLVAQDEYGNTKYTNEEQYNRIVAQGYGAYMQQDSSGALIEMERDEEGNLKEDQSAYYAKAIEAWWDTIDSQKEEMESLHETIEEGKTKVLELENSRNEILKEIRDNQMAVEEKVLAAIESSRQREIDALSEERRLLQESTDKYIEGLNESLNKEREMYERNQQGEELNRKQRQLDILRRSGGSGSQIRSLESEISGMQKDSYFDQQQTEIDAIKEASDLQLERLDKQIEVMTQTLEYQKEMGLLWGDVYTVMDGTPDEITEFIMTHDNEFWDDSPLKTEDQFRETFFAADQWAAFREDQAEAYNQDYISHTEDLATMQDAVYGNGSNYNWGIFNESMKRLYGDQWEEVANKYKGQFMSTYAQSGDITKASSDICSALSGFSSSMTSALNNAYSGGNYSTSGPSSGSSGGSGGSGGSTSGNNNPGGNPKYGYKFTFNGHSYDSGKIYNSKKEAENAGYAKRGSLISSFMTGGYGATRQQQVMNNLPTPQVYRLGGLADYTGLAWLDGTKSKPESVLNAEQTRILRNDILGSQPNSLMNLLLDFRSAMSGMASQSDYNTIDRSASMIIENATVNMNVSSIANDYDARRAGEQALSEMMRIARKTSAKNSVGR